MMKQLFAAMFAIVLAISFSTLTFAQEKAKEEGKKDEKMEMTKAEKQMGPLMSVTCDPTCGFMCRSHDEKELTSFVKQHAMKMHNKKLSTKDVKAMMKTEESTETKQ